MSARGHDAMVAQMLDMVCDGPVSATAGIGFAEAERSFDRFSLAGIRAVPYHGSGLEWAWFLDQNSISNRDIHILFGGLRHAVFNEDCCLTKHALFRMRKGVVPHPHPHVTTGVTCTDFSAVLRHYKFAGGVIARERKLLSENRIALAERQQRIAMMERDGDVDLGRYAECRNPTVDGLVEQGFLKISDAAWKMLA